MNSAPVLISPVNLFIGYRPECEVYASDLIHVELTVGDLQLGHGCFAAMPDALQFARDLLGCLK